LRFVEERNSCGQWRNVKGFKEGDKESETYFRWSSLPVGKKGDQTGVSQEADPSLKQEESEGGDITCD